MVFSGIYFFPKSRLCNACVSSESQMIKRIYWYPSMKRALVELVCIEHTMCLLLFFSLTDILMLSTIFWLKLYTYSQRGLFDISRIVGSIEEGGGGEIGK